MMDVTSKVRSQEDSPALSTLSCSPASTLVEASGRAESCPVDTAMCKELWASLTSR